MICILEGGKDQSNLGVLMKSVVEETWKEDLHKKRLPFCSEKGVGAQREGDPPQTSI